MKKTNSNMVLVFILIIFIVGIGIFNRGSLENNFEVSIGEITDMGLSRNSGNTIFIKFKFSVKNDLHYGNTGIICDRHKKYILRDILLSKKLLVVYDKKNFDNCKMLFRKSDYSKYKLNISPDYLKVINSVDSICSK